MPTNYLGIFAQNYMNENNWTGGGERVAAHLRTSKPADDNLRQVLFVKKYHNRYEFKGLTT